VNRLDRQPRVVVPWEDIQSLLARAGGQRQTPPEALDGNIRMDGGTFGR